MKKQRSNNKFLKIAAVSLALLALPPLAVYGQTVRCRAAQPRPALPGVMSDEIRLDPVAGALYRYGVQGGINRADSYWSDNVFTVLRGKLKQAATRGLLSREQLGHVLISNLVDLLNLVRGSEAVKEVEERNSALDSRKMCNGSKVHTFLWVV